MNNQSRDLELEKKIDAYIKGNLSEEEAQQLWQQLLKRPDYIELLETELGVKSILQQRDSDDTDQETAANEKGIVYTLYRSRKWIAAAAAVILLVVSINILQMNTHSSISEAALKDINLTENLSSAQILRSQKSDMTPADSLLNRGFEAAISGDVNEALAMYNKIIDRYGDKPAVVQAHLNKGIIQYNSGEFKNSISSFMAVIKKAKSKSVEREKAYWYMGNAYVNLNQFSKAREAIQNTYSMDGIYRKPSFRLLKKLNHELDDGDLNNSGQQMNEQ